MRWMFDGKPANQQAFHMKTIFDLPPPLRGAAMLNLGSAALTPARLAEELKSARMIA
jgi:hypothetical protein